MKNKLNFPKNLPNDKDLLKIRRFSASGEATILAITTIIVGIIST